MAYVDHAFSISDEDIMMGTSYSVNNKPPIKEILLAVSLLVFGALGIILGVVMAANKVGGDRAHDKVMEQVSKASSSYKCILIELDKMLLNGPDNYERKEDKQRRSRKCFIDFK